MKSNGRVEDLDYTRSEMSFKGVNSTQNNESEIGHSQVPRFAGLSLDNGSKGSRSNSKSKSKY